MERDPLNQELDDLRAEVERLRKVVIQQQLEIGNLMAKAVISNSSSTQKEKP
jgi:SMC interacting uncharacterized protein involved in chromosome segregation